MTSITITDPAVLAQLKVEALAQGVEVRDPSGQVLGTLILKGYGKPPPGYVIPIPEEELERRRQIRTGRPLADIMRDLQARFPEEEKS